MIRYVFAEGPIALKNAKLANPKSIGDALTKIDEELGGQLTPKATVDAARDPDNPLHPHFEWDNAIAAEAYRLDQARTIIRLIRVEDDEKDEEPRPAFLSIYDGSKTSYRTLDAVTKSLQLQLAVLKAAERDLAAWERRYRELGDICSLVEQARETIAARRVAIEAEARPI